MDACSLTTSHYPCSAATFAVKHLINTASTSTSTTLLAFSREPPPPQPRRPAVRPEPRNNTTNNKPTNYRSLSSTSKTLKNPLKNLVNSSYARSPPPTNNALTLFARLRLSSKLNPPPPPPPPPTPQIQTLGRNLEEEQSEESEIEGNEVPETEFRQVSKIFVGNLPTWIKEHEVTEFFRQFGLIKNVLLVKGHNETERNAGFGFVIYEGATAEKSAMKAVEFDGVEFHGRVLTGKLDDGRRLKEKTEERVRWVEGDDHVEKRVLIHYFLL